LTWQRSVSGGRPARGCRLWDVDGNAYIDLMCSYGPTILGRGHEDVEQAADRQRAQADIANGPSPCLAELAELVETPAARGLRGTVDAGVRRARCTPCGWLATARRYSRNDVQKSRVSGAMR
jgi:Aminotransferase class-III